MVLFFIISLSFSESFEKVYDGVSIEGELKCFSSGGGDISCQLNVKFNLTDKDLVLSKFLKIYYVEDGKDVEFIDFKNKLREFKDHCEYSARFDMHFYEPGYHYINIYLLDSYGDKIFLLEKDVKLYVSHPSSKFYANLVKVYPSSEGVNFVVKLGCPSVVNEKARLFFYFDSNPKSSISFVQCKYSGTIYKEFRLDYRYLLNARGDYLRVLMYGYNNDVLVRESFPLENYRIVAKLINASLTEVSFLLKNPFYEVSRLCVFLDVYGSADLKIESREFCCEKEVCRVSFKIGSKAFSYFLYMVSLRFNNSYYNLFSSEKIFIKRKEVKTEEHKHSSFNFLGIASNIILLLLLTYLVYLGYKRYIEIREKKKMEETIEKKPEEFLKEIVATENVEEEREPPTLEEFISKVRYGRAVKREEGLTLGKFIGEEEEEKTKEEKKERKEVKREVTPKKVEEEEGDIVIDLEKEIEEKKHEESEG